MNVEFNESDLLTFMEKADDQSVDVALLIEVAFILPSYRAALKELSRVLRPGGLLFIAFRSQYYNLLQTIQHRLWEGASLALREREGHLFGGSSWFSWQTPEDARRLLETAGFNVLNLKGIGVCSGIEGDPLASVSRPSKFSPEEQKRLMEIECAVAEAYASTGRYILATAEKKFHLPH